MQIDKNYSENPRINVLIESILDQLCPFLEEQAREISDLTAIGKALGTGKDISTLLEMILSIARRFTQADGGTLYLVDNQSRHLDFHVLFNESLNIRQSGAAIDLPPVQLYTRDGQQNLSNVSSYVFHTGKIVNIDDVYHSQKFKFNGTRQFDTGLNYKSQSMVVIPMRNHEDQIIGILQLINATNPLSGTTISFSKDAQEKAAALASQASVILTQQMLIFEMKELFEAFIKAIAVSIDEKSKHTAGHIQRVTELSMMIASRVNQDQGRFKNHHLSDDQMDELRIAALMHDTGKITTPDHIINKSSRLETVFDRFEMIQTRWDLFKTTIQLEAAQKKLDLGNSPDKADRVKADQVKQIDLECQKKLTDLDTELALLSRINTFKGKLDQTQTNALEQLGKKSLSIQGRTMPYLSDNELKNLNIPKGTLTREERNTIKAHADLTEKILSKLPWPRKLARIPAIASAHHEKLDGSGYPLKLDSSHLNIQARILAIADIFEALSAQDRPYKNPMPLSQTRQILEDMGKKGQLDTDIIDLFFSTRSHLEYARRHLSEVQIDL